MMSTESVLSLSIFNRRIADLLADYPAFSRILVKHHIACLGCYLATYCSLQDALDAYGLDPFPVLQDVRSLLASGAEARQLN